MPAFRSVWTTIRMPVCGRYSPFYRGVGGKVGGCDVYNGLHYDKPCAPFPTLTKASEESCTWLLSSFGTNHYRLPDSFLQKLEHLRGRLRKSRVKIHEYTGSQVWLACSTNAMYCRSPAKASEAPLMHRIINESYRLAQFEPPCSHSPFASF